MSISSRWQDDVFKLKYQVSFQGRKKEGVNVDSVNFNYFSRKYKVQGSLGNQLFHFYSLLPEAAKENVVEFGTWVNKAMSATFTKTRLGPKSKEMTENNNRNISLKEN